MDLTRPAIAATIALVALLVFVCVYAWRAPWYSTPYGHSIMATKAAVAVVAIGVILAADAMEAVGWLAVATVILWRLSMLWRDTRHSDD